MELNKLLEIAKQAVEDDSDVAFDMFRDEINPSQFIEIVEQNKALAEALRWMLAATNNITTEYPTGYDGDKCEQMAYAALALVGAA